MWTVQRLRRGRTGVDQLEKNLARLLPASATAAQVRRTSRAGMRSYMRYFYEAFASHECAPSCLRRCTPT